MKNLVNRRSDDYHIRRLNEITDLDIIASTILAINWSRRHCDTYSSQGLIQMDCVACCFVKNSAGTTELWVASNSQTILNTDIDIIKNDIGDNIPVFIVYNGRANEMHAEMQLIVELKYSNYTTNYIGVSKPCCKKCKQILDDNNITYTNWHQSDVHNWQSPEADDAYINN